MGQINSIITDIDSENPVLYLHYTPLSYVLLLIRHVLQEVVGVLKELVGVLQATRHVLQGVVGVLKESVGVLQATRHVLQGVVGVLKELVGVLQATRHVLQATRHVLFTYFQPTFTLISTLSTYFTTGFQLSDPPKMLLMVYCFTSFSVN